MLMGLQIGAAMEISVKDTQKGKNKSTLQSNFIAFDNMPKRLYILLHSFTVMSIAILFTIAQKGKQLAFPSTNKFIVKM